MKKTKIKLSQLSCLQLGELICSDDREGLPGSVKDMDKSNAEILRKFRSLPSTRWRKALNSWNWLQTIPAIQYEIGGRLGKRGPKFREGYAEVLRLAGVQVEMIDGMTFQILRRGGSQ